MIDPKPVKLATPTPDPLAGLAAPSEDGPTYKPIYLTKGSHTIEPGIYPQIEVGGNATLTMMPGIYVIRGGGFTVSSDAIVTGTGVMIYNAGSKFPAAGGQFGSFTISGGEGEGVVRLTPPQTGPYAGVAIFQSRDNTRPLAPTSFAFVSMGGGLIYAPAAQLQLRGDADLEASLIVNRLSVGGDAGVFLTDGSPASVASQTKSSPPVLPAPSAPRAFAGDVPKLRRPGLRQRRD